MGSGGANDKPSYKKMIPYEEAIDAILSHTVPIQSETVATNNALGRVVSSSVQSPVNLPPFDNSAMDGFAIRSEDTTRASESNPVCLRVVETVVAGDALPEIEGVPGTASEVMTGSPFPKGYDTVAKVEDVERSGDAILIRKYVPASLHIRKAGEDFKESNEVFRPGERLDPHALSVLYSLGLSEVPVARRLRVSVIATGDELVDDLERELRAGEIRNSNSPFLNAVLDEPAIDVSYAGVFKDRPRDFMARMQIILQGEPDAIICTGGVSMGKHDFVLSAIRDLGGRILFHKTKIRPGKPILVARIGGTMFFGLPGNPVSTMVGYEFFVKPWITRSLGMKSQKGLRAILSNTFRKPESLKCFYKARASQDEWGVFRVEILEGQASFMLSSVLKANAWAVLEPGVSEVASGKSIQVYLRSERGFS